MFTCCSGSYDTKDYGNCATNEDLDGTCFDKWDACVGKCPNVNTDFDVDIEGAFVEEA